MPVIRSLSVRHFLLYIIWWLSYAAVDEVSSKSNVREK